MKRHVVTALILLAGLAGHAQSYRIHVTVKPYAGKKIYLGYYYGKLKALQDSAVLDANASGEFKGKDKLPGGIYFIVSPTKAILFEILVDKTQTFSVSADSAKLPNGIVFTGSPENLNFQAYSQHMTEKGKAIQDWQAALKEAKSNADSAAITAKIRAANEEIAAYRTGIEKNYPGSLLSALLYILRDPVVPPKPESVTDSAYGYHYFKAHYWDSISLTDERLIRTPVFEPKLDRYFKDLVAPDPDSINREVDHMLLYSRSSKEMFKYLLIYFTQKYINPEFMGQDAAFVHIFEKYINTGQAEFLTEKYRKYVNDRAYSLMANLIGQPAANMQMTDTAGKTVNLYDLPADFMVVVFWDPTCSHCKETVPKVDSIYQAKWRGEGVKIFGVMVDGGHDNWLAFIRDHHLDGWEHVYQTKEQHDAEEKAGHPDYRQYYDVYQTPVMYLLDRDKRIIGKKLTYLQFDEVIDLKRKAAHAK